MLIIVNFDLICIIKSQKDSPMDNKKTEGALILTLKDIIYLSCQRNILQQYEKYNIIVVW